jgi:FtsH-binding integral membrane protein
MQEPLDAQWLTVGQEESEITRSEFIQKTYMHVALAVLGFVLVEALFLNTPFIVEIGLAMTQGMTWLLVLGGFMFATTALEKWAMRSTSKAQQYGAMALYIILEAFIFVPILYMAIYYTESTAVLNQAVVVTLSLFAGLSIIALTTKKDFSFLRSALTIGGFVAIGLIVAGMLFGFSLGIWFSAAMVLLAGGSILYQTSNIIHHYNKNQYVAAALGLFASLMLLFWYILQIFMSND